jgi:hypothetical protein
LGKKNDDDALKVFLEAENINPNNPEPQLCIADIFSR